MPKIGMEAIRKKALVEATIHEVGTRGTLEVTVSQIARRAGVSSGLAHHYFGNKEQILIAAMRHILKRFGALVRAELTTARTPTERVEGVIRASLDPEHFEPATVAAWLAFYVEARNSEDARRLLRVYTSRLHSNFRHDLLRLLPDEKAEQTAQMLAAMIDGFYIRHALQNPAPDGAEIIDMLTGYLHQQLQSGA